MAAIMKVVYGLCFCLSHAITGAKMLFSVYIYIIKIGMSVCALQPFNTVFPVLVLVFDFEEFSEEVLHGHSFSFQSLR
jgi:hypothetical protein